MHCMIRRAVSTVLLCGTLFLFNPGVANAYPFGGQASIVWPCFNVAIYTKLGPPRGGFYVWTTATRTYKNGPPTHGGQWLLGLTSIPYFCLVWIAPVFVLPGISISMMGSSGGRGPAPTPVPDFLGGGGGGAGGGFTLPSDSQRI